jgi:hypothetical protein
VPRRRLISDEAGNMQPFWRRSIGLRNAKDGDGKIMAEAAKFSVLWEDQASKEKRAMHMTGFDDELAARRFALHQREKGMRIVAVFTVEGMFRKDQLEKWLEGPV